MQQQGLVLKLFCRPSDKEHSARANDTLSANGDIAICERQAAALFLDIDVRLHPITNFGCAREIEREIGSDQARWRIRRRRQGVAQRNVGQRGQDTAMYGAAGIAMLRFDTKADYQIGPVAATKERADQVEDWTRAEQRFEIGGYIHTVAA
jgi:hypothetical protein